MRSSSCRTRRSLAALAISLAMLAGTSCGTDSSDEPDEPRHALTAAVHELQAAFDEEDMPAICRLMTKPAQVQAGNMGHGDPSRCERDVARVFGMIRKGGGWIGDQPPKVTAVEVEGDRGIATVSSSGRSADVAFLREDGSWKLESLFGVPRHRAEAAVRSMASAPFPGGEEAGAEVWTGSHNPCTDVSAERFPRVSGGCQVEVASSGRIPLVVLSVFGDFKFDDCAINYRFAVDADGHAWADSLVVQGVDPSACGDVTSCAEKGALKSTPWKGRIRRERGGAFVHDMTVCLETCVGAFTGQVAMRLERHGAGWRAEPAQMNRSGFQLDGALIIDWDDFDVTKGDPPSLT